MAKRNTDLRTLSVKSDPRQIDVIIEHIRNGGSATELCKVWQVSYSSIMAYIRSNPEFKKKYDEALADRDEWAKERILQEIRDLGTYNIKDAVNPDGSMKRLQELPDQLAAAVKEIDPDGGIKFQDKLKALDLYGKKLALFVERKEISGTVTLEQLVNEASQIIEGDKHE